MKTLLAAVIALGILAPAALAASHPSLKVSPSTVTAGNRVRLSGLVGNGCHKGSQVTITSRAFKGSTTHKLDGIPAVLTTVGKNHSFSVRVKIRQAVVSGTYKVGGRCGAGNFARAALTVQSGSPGFY